MWFMHKYVFRIFHEKKKYFFFFELIHIRSTYKEEINSKETPLENKHILEIVEKEEKKIEKEILLIITKHIT